MMPFWSHFGHVCHSISIRVMFFGYVLTHYSILFRNIGRGLHLLILRGLHLLNHHWLLLNHHWLLLNHHWLLLNHHWLLLNHHWLLLNHHWLLLNHHRFLLNQHRLLLRVNNLHHLRWLRWNISRLISLIHQFFSV
jgi:hypothetical protein